MVGPAGGSVVVVPVAVGNGGSSTIGGTGGFGGTGGVPYSGDAPAVVPVVAASPFRWLNADFTSPDTSAKVALSAPDSDVPTFFASSFTLGSRTAAPTASNVSCTASPRRRRASLTSLRGSSASVSFCFSYWDFSDAPRAVSRSPASLHADLASVMSHVYPTIRAEAIPLAPWTAQVGDGDRGASRYGRTMSDPHAGVKQAATGRDDLPLSDYNTLRIGDLGHRIRPLDADDVQTLLDYERAHGHRAPVVRLLTSRLATLAARAEQEQQDGGQDGQAQASKSSESVAVSGTD